MPPADDYYQKQFRVSRTIPFHVINEFFFTTEEIPYNNRLASVLQIASGRENLLAEFTKLKLAWNDQIDSNIMGNAICRIRAHEAGYLRDFLNVLVIASWLIEQDKDIPNEISSFLTDFSFELPQKTTPNFETEQLYSIVCQILSGQLYPESVFAKLGISGREMQNCGEKQAIEWIQNHSWYGFIDWNPDLNILVPALVALSDYSIDDQIRELATVFLDKLLYLLALTSWKGCPLPIGNRVSSSQLKSEKLHSFSSLGLLLWGQGSINENCDGAIYLALSNNYSLPDIIRSIAQNQTSNVWGILKDVPLELSDDGVLQAIYKTCDYTLASASIQSVGKDGNWEHLWQAILGTEAVVFTNLPESNSESDFRPKGFWRGNSVLPRLVQWYDSLVCIYDPQKPYPLGYTHAYFPLYAFDDYLVENNWAFARKDDAYIALYALNGLELVTEGDDANRELRSYGEKNVWCCQMGRKIEDHSFENFCQEVRTCIPEIDHSFVIWNTLRKQKIVFGWDKDVIVNDIPLHLLVNKHIESPFGEAPLPASKLDIEYQGDILRLNFE